MTLSNANSTVQFDNYFAAERKAFTLEENQGSLQHSQNTASESHPEKVQSSQHLHDVFLYNHWRIYNHRNPLHARPSHFFKIHFNNITSMPRPSKWSLSFTFPRKKNLVSKYSYMSRAPPSLPP